MDPSVPLFLDSIAQRSEVKYRQFLQLAFDAKTGKIDITETLIERVNQLFRRQHPDLIAAFNAFLPTEYQITLPLRGHTKKKKTIEREKKKDNLEYAISFANYLKEHIREKDFKRMLLSFKKHRSRRISTLELYHNVAKILQRGGHSEDQLERFRSFFPDPRCGTPCFRLRPEDRMVVISSERTAMDASVLNNVWESVPYIGCGASQRKWTRSEEQSFRIEDELFEMDMMNSEKLKETLVAVEPGSQSPERQVNLKMISPRGEPQMQAFTRSSSNSEGISQLKEEGKRTS